MRVLATIEEYDRHADKAFIYDTEGDYENGALTFRKDGDMLTLHHEDDLTPEGCRIKILRFESVKEVDP